MRTVSSDLSASPAVLVTGAGGPAGVAVIRHLLERSALVVAADADPDATGLWLVERSGTVPGADEPGFVEALVELGRRHGAGALISTVAEEHAILAEHADELRRGGLSCWLNAPQVTETCLDKLAFARRLGQLGLPTPPTWILGEAPAAESPTGFVVKPRRGRGSRGVHEVADHSELERLSAAVRDAIVQVRLVGQELTADVLANRAHELVGAVPRWRQRTQGGISVRGETFRSAELREILAAVVAGLGLEGPANVQGFATDAGFVITEVNPRYSGGLPLSLAAGADLVGQYLRGILGEEPDPAALDFRPGVRMRRYFAELFSFPDPAPAQ
jgi:carbamoylphosphate synthase large subunit